MQTKMPTPDVARLAGVLVASLLIYQFLKAIYNISPLHPLSRIPGPWLSGATYLPEFWWDVIQNGRYTRRIEEMHRQYGKYHLTGSQKQFSNKLRPYCSHKPQ